MVGQNAAGASSAANKATMDGISADVNTICAELGGIGPQMSKAEMLERVVKAVTAAHRLRALSVTRKSLTGETDPAPADGKNSADDE